MTGATGNLTVDLGPGNDTAAPNARQGIVTNNGPDEVIGGPGIDKVTYLQHFFGVHVSLDDVANDGTRAGAEGDNIRSDVENLEGSFAGDTLIGSANANQIRGMFGSDQLYGLGGNDTFLEGHFARPYDHPDTLHGGDGVDTASYAGNTASRWISLDDVANDGEDGEKDNVRSDVENVIGGAGRDVLTGSPANNAFTGGAGDDTLNGGDGDDTLLGDAGTDTADGGQGVDTCVAEVRKNCP
jgi:Ca2+-binding RTX toxin-like protein